MAPTKLSGSLKALLHAPHARGGALPAPPPNTISALFTGLSSSAKAHGVGHPAWLTLSTATLVTLNSPATLCELFSYATKDFGPDTKLTASVERAAVMREAGLKTISFSGIPRAINSLGALRSHLPPEVAAGLPTTATRLPTPANVSDMVGPRALGLWNSIYEPYASKLLAKLAASHPDLPVHILSSHYGALLADPPTTEEAVGRIGRVLTSVVAIACLRAQQGVTPQVISHVYGLKKALDNGPDGVEGEEFLVSDAGCEWVLQEVDKIVAAVAGGTSSFASAPGRESKL